MKHLYNDTIFSTSNQGASAIKIIRISGKEAHKISKIFSFKPPKPRTFEVKKLTYRNKLIDVAPVIWFPDEKSYTGESTYELHIHGSPVIEKIIYGVLSSHKNFRIADPGEFTKRAVLNGKLDLLQAESINNIILAKTEEQLRLGQRQLQGSLSKEITNWRNELLELATIVETLIDFSDEEIPENLTKRFENKRKVVMKDIEKAVKNSQFSSLIHEGFSVAIIGRPNVGKSSLINAISKLKVSIVSDIPGTTRDLIKQTINLNGIVVNFYDTAGLRKTYNKIEKEGIALALSIFKNCQIVLNLSDNQNFYLPLKINNLIKKYKVKVLNIKTKVDINKENSELADLMVSSKKLIGIEKLLNIISNHLSNFKSYETTLLTSERQVNNSIKALRALKRTSGLDLLRQTELVAEEIRESVKFIGKITSSIDNEEILDEIFGRFCIGK